MIEDLDDETCRALGRVTWAAIRAESCLKKTCFNLDPECGHEKLKGYWLRRAGRVLTQSRDQVAARTVKAWLDRVDSALEKRNRLLHADAAQVDWQTADGRGESGSLGLYHWRTGSVTMIDPITLGLLADQLTASIEGWEEVHATSRGLRPES